MASIRRELVIAADPEEVWDAIRDVGAVHTRLAPGFVVDTRLEEGARLVIFGSGLVARELIVDVDDKARRLAWAVVGGRLSHHKLANTRMAKTRPYGPGSSPSGAPTSRSIISCSGRGSLARL